MYKWCCVNSDVPLTIITCKCELVMPDTSDLFSASIVSFYTG